MKMPILFESKHLEIAALKAINRAINGNEHSYCRYIRTIASAVIGAPLTFEMCFGFHIFLNLHRMIADFHEVSPCFTSLSSSLSQFRFDKNTSVQKFEFS